CTVGHDGAQAGPRQERAGGRGEDDKRGKDRARLGRDVSEAQEEYHPEDRLEAGEVDSVEGVELPRVLSSSPGGAAAAGARRRCCRAVASAVART
ncbi:hypothetical protein THAOC_10095, partial [Thalassiosira oceanica]